MTSNFAHLLGRPMRAMALSVLLVACAAREGPVPQGLTSVISATRAPAQVWPPMVATAHPQATQAALSMLAQGGSAVDAAVAAQMVLGLVEPQSSGVGGGALAMHWDAASQALTSWDALAAAPSQVTAGRDKDVDGSFLDATANQRGGRSVGVPGTLALLETLHQQHGKLPWAALFAPAIVLAEAGFLLPPYLHGVLAGPNAARDHPELLGLYFGADGRVLPLGSTVRNPAYAKTLRDIARLGAKGWLKAGAALELVAAAQRGYRPSLMTEADVLDFKAQAREPLCAPFRSWRVCMMGPSSFGGVVVLQTLQMLQILQAQTDQPGQPSPPTGAFDFDNPAFVHQYLEASRLAQADRLLHVGDPAFVAAPLTALLAPHYLRQRAASIDMTRRMNDARPGALPVATAVFAPGEEAPQGATSQIAITDQHGNALSVTTTINLNFGARLMVGGYVLNNAMSNFSPEASAGPPRANQMAANKRPTSSMAPTIVFDERGQPVLVGGSAGGGQIVDYIAQALIEMLVHNRTPQQALARGHVSGAVLGSVQLERNTAAQQLAPALTALGHKVNITEMTSGLAFLQRTPQGWIGAADTRRDGAAWGP